jgi:transposase
VERYREQGKEETLFVGIDLHNRAWHVTGILEEAEVFSRSIPGDARSLKGLLRRYKENTIRCVYEAGYFGYWLYDELKAWGVDCIVTPPSLVPQEYGNRVKTDRRDSRKLAYLHSKGLLKAIYVPREEERYHRQVVRRRHQVIRDRVRQQQRIKSELRLFGIETPEIRGKWSKAYIRNLWSITFNDRWAQESFHLLLRTYEFLDRAVNEQTMRLKELSRTDKYRELVELVMSVPGIGVITAMEFLLELIDMNRFARAGQIAAYVGLTPSQYSSGDKVRMGHITKVGKPHLRASLIEASWQLIRKDATIRKTYERIAARAGGKRAIVAVARHLVIRLRRMLIDTQSYMLNKVA